MADSKLNQEQLQAVKHEKGPLLIIAGAGTGKTTVITKRIEHLILKKKVHPSNILALTFTEKAASEMETRIDEILPYGYTSLWIETFHAFCDRILRADSLHIGLNPSFDLLTEAESLLFIRKHLFEFELDYFRPLGNPMKFLQGMLNHFSRLKDDDTSPEQYLEFAKKLDTNEEEIKKTLELANAFKKYEELKAKAGVMDFSDLISNTLKLFRTRKNILSVYQEMFKYILVDEFQDTNYAQNELAILLSGHAKNITVVGDDDQSIYRWRGAALSNMLQFRSHFPKAKVVSLTKNYRSSQGILDSAYKLIQHNNPDRLEVKEKISKKLVSTREIKGSQIEFIYTNKAEDEAEEIAKKIQELFAKNDANFSRKYNDFAILVRANDHAAPIQRALDRKKIPYQFLGPGHLFKQAEIKDLIAYLHVLANFEDTASLYRVLTFSIFDLQARDIAAILNFSKKNNQPLFVVMEQIDKVGVTHDGKNKIIRIVEMMKRHLGLVPKETAGQILYYFFEDSGLLGHYLDPKSARTEGQAQNVAKFFEKLQKYSANHEDSSVFAVVDWIDLSMELGESPLAADIDWAEFNAVNILTVHSSKGLEFPVVFIVNLVTQRFPSRDRKEQIPVPEKLIKEVLPVGDAYLQEERRLFYVAMTRARDKLFFTAARFYGEGKRDRKLSPFVAEALGEEVVKSVIKKQTSKESVQQLSLLEIVNANIQNTPEKENKSDTLNPKPYTLNYISYSQLATFQTCPLHYKLRHILNFPSPVSPALSYGISMHSSLRDLLMSHKATNKINHEMIEEILKKEWINEGYSSKSHAQKAYQNGKNLLYKFWDNYNTEKPETIGIEMPFNFRLGKIKAGGRIDRVDKLDGNRIEIIDYKTGKNIMEPKKAKDDLQLSFYALAATEVHDKVFNKTPDEIILTLHYLEENKKVSTTRSKEELDQAKKKILDLVSAIENSDFKCTGGMMCKNCEYKMLCQV